MGPLDLFFHLLGFVAPALAVALLVALGARLLTPRAAENGKWWAQAAINFIVGTSVLLAGLWHYGVDGKMASYAAMVLAVATSQWAFTRAWRA